MKGEREREERKNGSAHPKFRINASPGPGIRSIIIIILWPQNRREDRE